MSVVKHIHKLRRHKYPNKTVIFFCTLDCNYKVEAALSLGKEVLCNQCNEPFTMTEYTTKLSKPHCSNCGRKEVKDSDGKKYYISKREAKLIAATAADDVNNLRSRLDSLTKDEEI